MRAARARSCAFVVAVGVIVGMLSAVPQAAHAAEPAPIAYVISYDLGTLIPVDTGTNTVLPAISLGGNPSGVAVTPDGRTAFVSNVATQSVTPVDLASRTLGSPIAVGSYPSTIAMSPNGKTAFVVNEQSDSVTSIDVAGRTAGPSIPVAGRPTSAAFNPDGTLLFVVARSGQALHVFDVATRHEVRSVPLGVAAVDVAVSPDGRTAWVVASDAGLIPVDVETGDAGPVIPVGSVPRRLAIAPDGSRVYVANQGDGTLTPVDLTTRTAGQSITVNGGVWAIAITPDGSSAYVTGADLGLVTPISLDGGQPGAPISVGSGAFALRIAMAPAPPPAVSAGGPYAAIEGQTLQLHGSAQGGYGALTTAWSVTPSGTCTIADPHALTTTVRCTDNGNFTLTLSANDASAASAVDAASLTTSNAAPVLEQLVVPQGVPAGSPLTVNATSTDAGGSDTLATTWTWGDGTSSTTAGTTGTHTYATVGFYQVCATVVDDDGASSARRCADVTSFNPRAKASGTGTYLLAGSSLVTSFSLSAQYGSGAVQPTGQVRADGILGRMSFRSTSLAGIVVNGSQAYLKGVGTLDGAPGYAFLVSVKDSRLLGLLNNDRIRIKIVKLSNGSVVYDTQPGAGELAAPTTLVVGNVSISN